jgi:hypothetical protein
MLYKTHTLYTCMYTTQSDNNNEIELCKIHLAYQSKQSYIFSHDLDNL